jgi:error-prone DNA polymerase
MDRAQTAAEWIGLVKLAWSYAFAGAEFRLNEHEAFSIWIQLRTAPVTSRGFDEALRSLSSIASHFHLGTFSQLRIPRNDVSFVELAARSSFSFLRGASHPEELVERAKEIKLPSLALCDRDGLYGAARAHARARELEQHIHLGAEIPIALSERDLLTSFAGCAEAILGPLSDLQLHQLLRDAKPNAHRKRLLVEDGYPSLLLLVKSNIGYQNLCWLLTKAHADLPKGECLLDLEDLAGHVEGLVALVPTILHPAIASRRRSNRALAPHPPLDSFPAVSLARLCELFEPGAIYSVTYRRLNQDDGLRRDIALQRESRHGLPVLASAWPRYHHKDRRRLADVLHCIRVGTTLSASKTSVASNAQAYLRSPAQMRRLFQDHPEWVERTVDVASQLLFGLEELHYHFPCHTSPGETPYSELEKLSWKGAEWRYPNGIPSKVKRQIETELALIDSMNVAPYFLSTREVVQIARERGILCQGRGSAANSAVCYVLGITAVNPDCSSLLFERFMSAERKEPPDIDVDFEHERREEVIQELYRRYGRDQAAMVSEVICFRRKSALREVSKTFGLSADQCDRLASIFSHWDGDMEASAAIGKRLSEVGLDPSAGSVQRILEISRELMGFPRHLSIHVGGFVLSSRPLHEVSPVEPARMAGRSVVPWDKDDLDILGFFKIDVLALGMLTAIRKSLHSIWKDGALQSPDGALSSSLSGAMRAAPLAGVCDTVSSSASSNVCSEVSGNVSSGGSDPLSSGGSSAVSLNTSALAPEALPNDKGMRGKTTVEAFDPLDVITRIPDADPAVYAMTAQADTVGVFQIESRAQMAMLPRLRPQCFYDLVIEVAIVRPGPIQGGMVHPYLRRRNQEEAPECHPSLREILSRTFGVPLFQEQVMQIAITGAGYSGGEADQLRRDMAAWKRTGRLLQHRQRLLDGFARNGIEKKFGEALFEQIKGFGEYGFPESHAASFAALVYKSAWLKAHYPAHFVCALLNSQPMGFYSAGSLVKDAQKHGVEVRPVSVLESDWDCTLEPVGADAPGKVTRAVRLGLRMIKGLSRSGADRLLDQRRVLSERARAFLDFQDVIHQVPLSKGDLEALAEAGAFEALLPGRRQVLWAARAPRQLGLFQGVHVSEPTVELPPLKAIEVLVLDYDRVRLSIDDHPLRHVRAELESRSIITAAELAQRQTGSRVTVAGLVLARQRPGTASGVVFLTLEDETGIINLVFYSRVFEAYRHAAQHSQLLVAQGKVERQDPKPGSVNLSDPREKNGVASVIHLIVESAARLELVSTGQTPAIQGSPFQSNAYRGLPRSAASGASNSLEVQGEPRMPSVIPRNPNSTLPVPLDREAVSGIRLKHRSRDFR